MTRPTFLAAGFLCASVLALATGCGGGSGGDGGAGGGGNPVTGSAKLSWTAPTTRTDGSPLTDLAGYLVYVDRAAPVDRLNASVTSAGLEAGVVLRVAAGTSFVAVTAVDGEGNESLFSNELTVNVP